MTVSNIVRGVTRSFIIVSYLTYQVANAQPSQQGGDRRGPPPEAIEACADQSEGAACSFSGRRGDVTGTCITLPQEDEGLACAPEGGPPGGDRDQ
ncbi:MAG: hypothetical protein KDI17_02190 [Halioglobus sp.]|nr:hypothetical protein [Halioglobus sp.]